MNPLAPSVTDRLDQLHDQFNQAQPFRHLVIDQFFQTDYARQLQSEFPNFEERFALNEMGKLGGKAVRPDLPDLSETYAGLDAYIQSPEFLQTISRITGIPDLLYDPDYVGGGTHENVHGQGLSPHVDFNYLPKTQWHRRLNLIIYMNDEWKQEWGGCLDLHKNPWNHELDEVQTVLPLFNRCVIFETNEISWHGFERIELPESERHRSRRSIAIYLYTRERPAEETAPSHGTIYVPPGLPRGLQSGQTLAHEDYLELRRRFAQLKGQLKFLYERELETSRQIAEMSAAFFGKDKKGVGLLSAWTGRPDPSLTYTLLYSKNSYFNAARADVPAGLPEALAATRASENIDARKKAFATVQRIVMENALACPLAFQFELDALSPKVKGFKPNLLGKPKYEGVWLES